MLTLIALFVTGEFHATHIPFTSKNSHCTDGMGGKFPCLANNLSGVSDGKDPAYSAGDLVLIPGLTIQLIMDWRRQQLYPQL